MSKYLLLLGVCLLFLACPATSKIDTPTAFVDQVATVRVHVATRGSYQYLLEISQEGEAPMLCMPSELPEGLQKDGQLVRFSGRLLPDSTMIMKPGPTDMPVEDFMVPNLDIETIEAG